MGINTGLISELTYEASNTRKMLERIPEDQFDWKPHDKSTSLGRLACHIAELPRWINYMMANTEFDFTKDIFDRVRVSSKDEIMAAFDTIIQQAVALLAKATDEELNIKWTLRRGEMKRFELPRKAAIRNMVMNHIIHHRAQLSVYLRLLNVPVPGMYGPSADEK
ncbi:DinB family protein [Agriterribacter sp.]|uniref:DinB family protein n=1 Tax=Agriterribacter sp. TaxID=2821509 RepID=UPI002CE04012|nr:DinB family protein [Agriterribacter sp.]HTN05560.1 DinB family protein [Agriterribacter sp.]